MSDKPKATRPEKLPDVLPVGTRFDWGGRSAWFTTEASRRTDAWTTAYVGRARAESIPEQDVTVLSHQIDWVPLGVAAMQELERRTGRKLTAEKLEAALADRASVASDKGESSLPSSFELAEVRHKAEKGAGDKEAAGNRALFEYGRELALVPSRCSSSSAVDGQACTGFAASWCPNCGDCKCPRRENGELIEDGDEPEADQARNECPLHGEASADAPERCPTCSSPAPHLHPAVQSGGEVEPCSDAFHLRATPENRVEYRELVTAKRAEPPPDAASEAAATITRQLEWFAGRYPQHAAFGGKLSRVGAALNTIENELKARDERIAELQREVEHWQSSAALAQQEADELRT